MIDSTHSSVVRDDRQANIHLSAGTQIGGVFRALSGRDAGNRGKTIVFIGAKPAQFSERNERLKAAVLASGVLGRHPTPIYDVVHNAFYRSTKTATGLYLRDAVACTGEAGASKTTLSKKQRLFVTRPIIIKYGRPVRTQQRVLEESLPVKRLSYLRSNGLLGQRLHHSERSNPI